MDSNELTEEDHKARSNFIKRLIQYPDNHCQKSSINANIIPKQIVQYWDSKLPNDVKECIKTWAQIEKKGFERLLFDKQQAEEFILQNLGLRYLKVFEKCYHPAMQSDYFRLCYIFVKGGCYVDTDDIYNGRPIQHLFTDGRLKIQPLCYDIDTHMMVPPPIFTKRDAFSSGWIFYVNNNPLIACSKHPIIERALNQATQLLELNFVDSLPEIQATTGPGILSKSIFDIISKHKEMENTIHILNDWEDIAKSKWELDYRNDARNWRNSNCKNYVEN